MKKIILLMGLFLFTITTTVVAQSLTKKEQQQLAKEAKKAVREQEQQALFQQAVQALTDQSFVLGGDRITFKRGRSAFVSSNTNFISLNDDLAVVQIASNGPYSGQNGIGGITVEGRPSNIKMDTDKRGNVHFSMMIQGLGISARVSITLTKGGNEADALISPNFNSRRMTLSGTLHPHGLSNIFKGRSF